MDRRIRRLIRFLPRSYARKLPRTIQLVEASPSMMRRLNRRYRKKDVPTSVLSFSYGPAYAEIIVCPALVRKEAKRVGNSYDIQMTWMILHGTLHISGLHHELSSAHAEKMEAIERRVLQNMRLSR